MAKRNGELGVEWDSPERKRLRNEGTMLHSLLTPHIPAEQTCANTIAALLQQGQSVSLACMMDAAVQLVQRLKQLQLFATPLARDLFEQTYGQVLNYVGDVVHKLQQAECVDSLAENEELESVQRSFAEVYQYLVELIARHAEYMADRSHQKLTDQEMFLVALPLAVRLERLDKNLATTDIPLLSDLGHCGRTLQAVGQVSAKISLIALTLIPTSYSGIYLPWTTRAYSWCLSRDPELRLVAWSLFPAFCFHTDKQGNDGYTGLTEKPRITVDDPAKLLEVVAYAIGFVSCARAGSLRVALKDCPQNEELDEMDNNEESNQGTNSQDVFGVLWNALGGASVDIIAVCSVYSCTKCDCQRSNTIVPAADARQEVTLSDWLPYWFIASSRQHEAGSARFVRNSCRFVRHAPPEEIALKTSPLGQGIIRRLSSSNREIRMAARDAIVSYSQVLPGDSSAVTQTKQANQVETMRIMGKLEHDLHGPSIVVEALALVAGSIGEIAQMTGDAMRSVLPFLVRHYCSANVFLRAVAMEQLLAVSQAQQVPLAQLLLHFAGSIASTLAATLEHRTPGAPFMQCMQMLGTTAPAFLGQFQAEIVADLFIWGNDTALKAVAGILDVRLPVVCVDQAASIFSRIFLMDEQLMQQAMARFVSLLSAESEMDQAQIEVNIPGLLRSCSVKLIFNLVLALGEEALVMRQRARSAVATVRCILDGSSEVAGSQGMADIVQANSDVGAESSELSAFMSRHILGVLAYMNELLREPGAASQGEHRRKQGVRAVGGLIELLGEQTARHTSNVVATLTPALSGPLAASALDAWVVLAETLQAVKLSADQVNALLVPLLGAFIAADTDRPAIAQALDRVVALHRSAIKKHFAHMCPVPEHPLLATSRTVMHKLGKRVGLRQRLDALRKLLAAHDATVVLCAAREIYALVQQNMTQITAWKAAFVPSEAQQSSALLLESQGDIKSDAQFIAALVNALRAGSGVSGALGDMAAAACAASLGAIGAVDIHNFEQTNTPLEEPREPGAVAPGLRDLNDEDERVEFVCTLVVDHLARAFEMAPSPSVQMFTAYSIQELLRLVGFSSGVVEAEAKATTSTKRKKAGAENRAVQLRQRWEMLPAEVRATIRPLLDSQYTIQSTRRAASTGARIACVRNSTTQVQWLRAWITELAQALRPSPAADLLRASLGAVKEGAAELLQSMLPQAVFQYSLQRLQEDEGAAPIAVDDDDPDADAVLDELLTVLDCDAELRMPADQLQRCRTATLALLDACDAQVRAQQLTRAAGRRSRTPGTAGAGERALTRILGAVPYDTVARAAATCGQLARAVQYTEQWQRAEHATLFKRVDDTVVARLQELYLALGDADGVAGAEQCRRNADARLTARRHELEGDWAHALIGHEALLRAGNGDTERWIACLQHMGQWEGAWAAAYGAGLEAACDSAAWRLRRWDWVRQRDLTANAPFDAAVGALLLNVVADGDQLPLKAVTLPLDADRQPLRADSSSLVALATRGLHAVGRELSNSGGASRNKADSEIRAHMLGDAALAAQSLGNLAAAQPHTCTELSAALGTLDAQWRARIACIAPAYAAQEPVLSMQAGVYDMIRERAGTCECGDAAAALAARTRLQAAQLARLGGNGAAALSLLTFADARAGSAAGVVAPLLQIEHAQVLWSEGRAADAIACVRRVCDTLGTQLQLGAESDNESDAGGGSAYKTADETRAAFSRAMFLQTRWQEETHSLGTVHLHRQYERAARALDSDRVQYAIAHLYDTMFVAMSEKDSQDWSQTQQNNLSNNMCTLQYYVVRYYSRAVMRSTRYLHRALPRLLTVWMDFGANALRQPESKKSLMVDRFRSANHTMTNMARRLPAYSFLVVLSQLVSRICHPNDDVHELLEMIILRVLELYPQQALWQLVGVQRSTYAARASRASALLAKARLKSSASGMGVGELVQQATALTDLLLGLCNAAPARSVTTMHMSRDFKALARAAPIDIVLPLQRCLVPTLPDAPGDVEVLALQQQSAPSSSRANATASQRAALHQPFAADLPTLSSFEDAVDIMHSLQRPKKITCVGSDGRRYSFLCKPKDDLRNDARLMEVNAMINQLLTADARTRPRQLHVRTYAVVPLNEECGLIEWVPATTGIRHVLLKLYKERGISISMAQVRAQLDAAGSGSEAVFTDKILPMFPPVMHEWFASQFADAQAWLAARTGFTRSAAVMSMVGHILGLGDRHCENILLDERSGSVVHVDFNCLFEKGMTLEKPEKVPFRLTQNMVDAMGATGYEGVFRKSCEMTLRLLHEHRDALMSVLESFLHDPLVEWNKRATRASRAKDANLQLLRQQQLQQPNEKATRCLNVIRKKLQGRLHGKMPLSIEGQVDELIADATDPKLLSQMYIGWAAFM